MPMHRADRPSNTVLPTKSDTDRPSTSGNPLGRHGNTQFKPVLVLPYRSNPSTTALSPPLVSRSTKPRPKNARGRSRSDSGLSLHTDQAAVRQYAGYNPGGSATSRPCHRRGLSYDENSSVDTPAPELRASKECKELGSQAGMLPDFFGPVVIKAAFSNPETRKKLCSFAKKRHAAADIEFLLKVSLLLHTKG